MDNSQESKQLFGVNQITNTAEPYSKDKEHHSVLPLTLEL